MGQLALLLQLFYIAEYRTKIRISIAADLEGLQYIGEMTGVGNFQVGLDVRVTLDDMDVDWTERAAAVQQHADSLLQKPPYQLTAAGAGGVHRNDKIMDFFQKVIYNNTKWELF